MNGNIPICYEDIGWITDKPDKNKQTITIVPTFGDLMCL
jgi:hypothetical protein